MNLDPRKQTRKYKKRQLAQIKYGFLVILFCAILMPTYTPYESTGNNTFDVYLNGTYVGKLGSEAEAENCLVETRKKLQSESDELVLADVELTCNGYEEICGLVDNSETVINNMLPILDSAAKETLTRAYTLKIGQYSINLASTSDVLALLQEALNKYQDDKEYVPVLNMDENRELSVLTASVFQAEETEEALDKEEAYDISEDSKTGIYRFLDDVLDAVEPAKEKDFDDYEQGLMSMSFADEIEVVECYLPLGEIMSLDDAIEEVVRDQVTPTIYKVVAGDTLSQISEKVNIPMDDIIAMNDSLENEMSMIHEGDELTITVPKAKLSVDYVVQRYFEEDYEAEIIYVDNDEWYTTDKKTLQEPSAGHHNVMAQVSYRNDDETAVTYLKEDVTYEAVAKIVERGTKIPPTYIKPIAGGRLTSTFGRRKRPTRGASSYHKGVDWATATGTPVYASSGGVVIRAGWGSGYGYCVYIQHPDGKVTRYGHLSKVLVSSGQSVSQGQRIALSGNTGVSTGPHLHFEILVNGVQVNPFSILN